MAASSSASTSPSPHLPIREDLDYSLVKISCEALSTHFQKIRKLATRELGQVISAISSTQGEAKTAEDLSRLKERLLTLREAIVAADAEEKAILIRCQKKLQQLQPNNQPSSSSSPSATIAAAAASSSAVAGGRKASTASEKHRQHHGLDDRGNRQLERMIGEYMLRMGYFEGLALLEEEEKGMQGIFDLDIFLKCKQVERQLLERNCEPALQWCGDHGSKLRRLNSILEFQLHKQQFLELVRQGDRMAAIQYASEYLSVAAAVPEHVTEVQQAMATLAFPNPEVSCPIPEYNQLFSQERWEYLSTLFAEEARRCYGMAKRSSLELCLQAGLTALKTPVCLDVESRNRNCPVCSTAGRALAEGLPFAHFPNSHLTCRCTGETMHGENPPMALPNGQVYSRRAIKEILITSSSSSAAGGKEEVMVTCPRTGDTFPINQVQNIFII